MNRQLVALTVLASVWLWRPFPAVRSSGRPVCTA